MYLPDFLENILTPNSSCIPSERIQLQNRNFDFEKIETKLKMKFIEY